MDVLTELADTQATSFDIDDYLHLQCERAHRLFDVRAAGVLLESLEGSLQLSAASTDDPRPWTCSRCKPARAPCVDAYRTGQQLVDVDLDEVADRWPQFIARRSSTGCEPCRRFRCGCATTGSER